VFEPGHSEHEDEYKKIYDEYKDLVRQLGCLYEAEEHEKKEAGLALIYYVHTAIKLNAELPTTKRTQSCLI
jgi:hypothetical protein